MESFATATGKLQQVGGRFPICTTFIKKIGIVSDLTNYYNKNSRSPFTNNSLNINNSNRILSDNNISETNIYPKHFPVKNNREYKLYLRQSIQE